MKHILLINGNPDPSPERLTSALAKAYREGAEDGGCAVRQIDVGGVEFAWLQNSQDFTAEAKDKTIIEAQGAFLAADHVVFIYPLWLGSAPALLKAYMERVACGDFLLDKNGGRFPRGRLKGRSARIIVTMGMPTLFYRLMFGGHGVKAFNRSIWASPASARSRRGSLEARKSNTRAARGRSTSFAKWEGGKHDARSGIDYQNRGIAGPLGHKCPARRRYRKMAFPRR